MYITHRAFIPPGRLSGAAACATKYTAHRPPHHNINRFSIATAPAAVRSRLANSSATTRRMPPDIDNRCAANRRSTTISLISATLGHGAHCCKILRFVVPNNKHTHNNNEEVPPVYHNQKGLIGFRYIRKSKLKVLYNIVGGGYTYYQCVHLIFKATTHNNQPTILRIVRGLCTDRFAHNNNRIRTGHKRNDISLCLGVGTNSNHG